MKIKLDRTIPDICKSIIEPSSLLQQKQLWNTNIWIVEIETRSEKKAWGLADNPAEARGFNLRIFSLCSLCGWWQLVMNFMKISGMVHFGCHWGMTSHWISRMLSASAAGHGVGTMPSKYSQREPQAANWNAGIEIQNPHMVNPRFPWVRLLGGQMIGGGLGRKLVLTWLLAEIGFKIAWSPCGDWNSVSDHEAFLTFSESQPLGFEFNLGQGFVMFQTYSKPWVFPRQLGGTA